MDFETFAIKWNRDVDNNFAVACFDQNSMKDLAEAAENDPDETDMLTWRISSGEYFDAIKTAIFEKNRS